MDNDFQRPVVRLEESLKQMQQMRNGELHKKTWDVNQDLQLEDELVQYFVVNSELNMSPGKIAAQVAHVATNITVSLNHAENLDESELEYLKVHRGIDAIEDVHKFKQHMGRQAKIILRGKQKDLEKLMEQGWYHIRDNGRTEIPEGSLTVIGCIPDYKSKLKHSVKRLQLL